MTAAYLPGNSTVELRTVPVPAAGPRRSAAAREGLHHLRLRHSLHLSRASRQRPGGLPGRDRRPRAMRPDRRSRPGLPPLQDRRPRHRLSHLRLRRVQRLPARLHDLLHQREVSPRLRLAARRRHGRVHDRRREGPDRAARRALLRRWRAGGLRLRHRLRGPGKDRHRRQPRRADYRPRPGRPGHRRALPQAGRATRSSASTSCRSA